MYIARGRVTCQISCHVRSVIMLHVQVEIKFSNQIKSNTGLLFACSSQGFQHIHDTSHWHGILARWQKTCFDKKLHLSLLICLSMIYSMTLCRFNDIKMLYITTMLDISPRTQQHCVYHDTCQRELKYYLFDGRWMANTITLCLRTYLTYLWSVWFLWLIGGSLVSLEHTSGYMKCPCNGRTPSLGEKIQHGCLICFGQWRAFLF